MSKVHDFAAAKRLVASLKDKAELDEPTLFGFAKQRKYEETIAAVAERSDSSIGVVRPLTQSWETASAVLETGF